MFVTAEEAEPGIFYLTKEHKLTVSLGFDSKQKPAFKVVTTGFLLKKDTLAEKLE